MQISFSVRSTPLGLSFLVCYYFQYKCFGLSCGYCLLNSPWCSMRTECLFSELCPSCWHCEKTSTATRSWAKRQLSRLWWEGDGKVRINITSFSFNPRWIRTVRLQCYLSFHLYQMEDRPTQIREMLSLSLVVCWIHAHSHLSTLYVFPLAAVFFSLRRVVLLVANACGSQKKREDERLSLSISSICFYTSFYSLLFVAYRALFPRGYAIFVPSQPSTRIFFHFSISVRHFACIFLFPSALRFNKLHEHNLCQTLTLTHTGVHSHWSKTHTDAQIEAHVYWLRDAILR